MNNIWTKIRLFFNGKRRVVPIKDSPSINIDIKKNTSTITIERLEEKKKNNETIIFSIKTSKKRGFICKIGDISGFISFYHMPWNDYSIEEWYAISNSIKGAKFYGKIHTIDSNRQPFFVVVDGNYQYQHFQTPNIEILKEYNGVVLKNTAKGLLVDIGLHFNWKCGSMKGFIYNRHVAANPNWMKAKAGDLISAHLLKKINTDKVSDRKTTYFILGNEIEIEWLNGELEEWCNTERTAVLLERSDGKRQFFIDGKYPTSMLVLKSRFKNKNETLIKLKLVPLYGAVKCYIRNINKGLNSFTSELVEIEDKSQLPS